MCCHETGEAGLNDAPYGGRAVAFLTRHGKQDLLSPALEAALGCRLVHTDDYDTDQLGTFTRDIPRAGAQIEAARRKAGIGMELTGARLAIGSEGAFGLDPFAGIAPWNVEILLWVDRERGIEVTGLAQGPARNLHRSVGTRDELAAFAREAGFPEYRLTLRPGHQDHPHIRKGLHELDDLLAAFDAALAESENGLVFVEHDLRAFCNPARQQVIREAGDDLIRKLRSACPHCASPGYWVSRRVPGLPCSSCGAPTRQPVGEV